MIFFVGNDGTVTNSISSLVYQGSAGANDVYLIAPFAVNLQATVAFKLPNGVWTERFLMTQIAEIKGVINEKTGKPYIGWRFSLPNEITQYYGTVTAQFFFYTGNSGVITATSAVSFTVGKGVPEVLPAKPTEEVYNQIIDYLSALSGQVENGAFAARAIYAWNSAYIYDANEITFYPAKGKFGAFIKSIKSRNTQPPYNEEGLLNSESWEEVVSFDHIADGYFTELKSLVFEAASSETNAQASSAAATEAMEEATRQAENAASCATAAQNAQTAATEQATAAASSAAQALASEQNAANSAADAESAKSAAALSATEAHGWADIAKQWADYGIKINTEYTSLDRLPNPGDSHFIYLISNGSTGENSYDEYIWADAKSAYEKIGTTEIDLTSYATKAEVNYGLNTKLDKSGGEVAGDITVNGCLNARNITAEQILGRGEVPIIEQNPRMFAINFGNIYNEMRLSGKSKRPVYIAWDKNSDSKYPECADEREIAFISDVDQKVNKSGDTMTGKLVLSELLITQHGNSSIEINPDASMPYIDFHYGDDTGTTEDYNVRLINDADGQLTCKGKFTVDGNITVNSYKTTVLDYFDMITGDGTNFGFTGASGNIYRLQEMYSPNNPPNAKALLAAYPIGAIYISTNSTSPASIFGGAWTVITEGYYLKAVTSGAGSYEIAGLPNITGSFLGNSYTSQSNYTSTGAFYNNGTASGASGTDKRCISNFNASRSSSVYGRSETVTPNNYSVYMWRRTA